MRYCYEFEKLKEKKGLLLVILFVFILATSRMVNATPVEVELTDEELEFIESHPHIRVGFDPEFVPFEFKDNDGVYKGICADYVKILNHRLGINMEPVEVTSWDDVMDKAQKKEIDVLPGIGLTESRKSFLIFTEPYIKFQRAIYTRNDFESNLEMSDLEKYQVAVQRNSSHHGYVSGNMNLSPVLYDTAEEALLAVATNKAEIYIGNLTTSNHIVKTLGISNVRVANTIENENGLAFAVRDDWPILKGILSKGLDSISEAERIDIINKWSGVEVKVDLSGVYRVIFQVALVFLLMISVTLYWMRVLKLENKERLTAQENLNQALSQLEVLYNSSLALSSTLARDEVLEMIVSKLREVIPFDYATIQTAKNDCYEIIYTVGFEDDDLIGYEFACSEHPLISQVILCKNPYVVEDNRFYFEPYGLKASKIRSRLILPLIFDDEVIGLLTLDHNMPNYFTSELVKWGTAFAIQAAIALNNAKVFEELKIARDSAEDATIAKGAFLANMSHEIRTPMNAIIGLTNLTLKSELTDKQRNYLSKVESSSKNLLGIINDILDFSKIEAGKLRIENIKFNLNTVMKDLADIISLKAHEKELEIIFDVDADMPYNLIGDPLRLGQILLNLTSNAIKFTEYGEIAVRVKLQSRDNDRVTLLFEVEDTGIGLTKKQEEVLFESFEQADVSTTRKYGGTGLGLSICKNLSKLMGGEIGFESEFEKRQ